MEKVLVADIRSRREGLRNLLVVAGYQVEFALPNSDLGGIVCLKSPSAVLLRFRFGKSLPEAACIAVRQASKGIPIIVLGPRTQTSAKVWLFELGADDFIEEPFDELELVARLRSMIRRSRFSAKSAM